MQLAPLTAVFSTVLFALPLAFTQKLDARGMSQQVQACVAGGVRNLNIQISLPPAQGAEVRNWPCKAAQL